MNLYLYIEINDTELFKAAATRAIFTYDFLLLKDVKEYIT